MKNVIRRQIALPLQAAGFRPAPDRQLRSGEGRRLAVEVVYTTDEGTQYAIRKAWGLARDLGAQVRIVFMCAVPYTLPLAKPAISLPFLQNKLVKLASDFPGEASVHIFLCRETLRALQNALPPGSVVVLGGRRRRWWPTQGQRMERRLQEMGHQVIFADSE